MREYEYLLFDNDGTLMNFKLDSREALEETFKMLKEFKSFSFTEEIAEIFNKCDSDWWLKLEKGQCTREEMRVGRFRDLFNKINIKSNEKEFCELYMKNISRKNNLIPGCIDIMKKLSLKYKIYIITNGSSNVQHLRIESSDYYKYVKGIFTSEEIGHQKPKKEYFNSVLKQINADEKECLIIGDSLTSDILGANNAGIDCVWYNPKKIKLKQGIKINYEIDNLEGLLKILLPK